MYIGVIEYKLWSPPSLTKAPERVHMPAKKKSFFAGTGVFGWMIIGIAIGGLIVLLRYLIISWVMAPTVYVIEPSTLIPGMGN